MFFLCTHGHNGPILCGIYHTTIMQYFLRICLLPHLKHPYVFHYDVTFVIIWVERNDRVVCFFGFTLADINTPELYVLIQTWDRQISLNIWQLDCSQLKTADISFFFYPWDFTRKTHCRVDCNARKLRLLAIDSCRFLSSSRRKDVW